ncbi:MAG: MATE family efflux transporter [Clostridia bacterium]|nr:MATE family efflux transporter [Clostridia bacterium]
MKNKNVDMCSGPLFLNILRFAFPVILADFLQRLYNAADVVIVGRYAGQEALAGVGTTGSLTTLILNLFIGLSIGVSVAVGQALGSNNEEKTHRTVHTAMLISVVFGILVSFIGVFFAKPLLKLISVPDDVMPQAKIYMQIVFVGKMPALVYTFGAAILRAKGDTKRPLYIALVSGLINVALNLFFVIKLHMAADGVALATTISQAFSAIAIIYIMCNDNDSTKLYIKKLKIYKKQIIEILRIGIPSGIQSTIFAASNVLVQSSVNSFGSVAIAGSAASNNIGGFYYGALHSFATTVIAFVSQNKGAGNLKRINKAVVCCIVDVCFVWLVTVLLTIFAGEQLISLYAPGNVGAIKMGVTRLSIAGSFYGLCGLMDVMAGALRGIGYSLSAMIISIAGVCGIRIVWILTAFKAIGTFESLFYCFPLSWLGTFLMHTVVYIIVKKRLDKNRINDKI